ncbi:hypothetical protein RUM43_004556 [Polyplax serrata]|uniref:Uncharacterized protein n=1 Tax=Polyplax serrata TaxID=468196 RepID=A0AAN8SAZ1_POLSC
MNVYPSVFNPKKKARGCESLASVDSCSEHEPPTGECKKLDETSPRTSLCRHSFVQDYVNSLIMEAAENGGVNPGEVQYLHHHQHQHRHYPYPNEKETDVGDEYSRNKCDSRARNDLFGQCEAIREKETWAPRQAGERKGGFYKVFCFEILPDAHRPQERPE